MHDKIQHKENNIKQYRLYVFVIGLGILMHFGTAILRLRVFYPIPKLIDFTTLYAYAVALRHDLTPDQLSVEWFTALQNQMRIPVITKHMPPVFWPLLPWFIQPLAILRYPAAVWLWLLCNLALLAWVTLNAYKRIITVYDERLVNSLHVRKLVPLAAFVGLFAVILTFGPVFLDLSIGQISVLLLAMCTLVGLQMLKSDSWRTAVITGLALSLSALAKLYPAIWLVPLVLMRRWKQLAVSSVLIIAVLITGFLLLPDSARDYWTRHLSQHITAAADQGSVDDQSLIAWLNRLTQPHTYEVSRLKAGERQQIVWEPGWALDPQWVQMTGYLLGGIIGLSVVYTLVRSGGNLNQGGFYLWVLYILMIVPHMERYNHALLLPAMIWLWQRGQCKLVAVVYLFTGLSRLNHLWVTLLPSPWAPLASGFGLFAVLTLMGGIFKEFGSQYEAAGSS